MYGDTWQVRWKEFLSDSYIYGSKIEFNEDGSVSYKFLASLASFALL